MKKLKVLLTNAPSINLEAFDRDHNKIKAYVLYPPIQLTTIAASVLKKTDDVEIEILDLEFHIMKFFKENEKSELGTEDFMKKTLVDKIDEFKPDLVGISILFSRSHSSLFKIANIVKEKNSSIRVVAGGNHATFAYKRMLKECSNLDLIFLYEGDTTFPLYLAYLKGKIKFEDLKGIAWLDKTTNEPTISSNAPIIENLDPLPIPSWDLIPLKQYKDYGRMGPVHRYGDENLPTYSMFTVRGCVASCNFCTVRSFYGKGVRAYTSERVLKEIDYLYNVLGIKQLTLIDDDFTFDKKRTLEVCRGLIKRDYDLVWAFENGIRLGTLDEEVLEALVAAKCRLFLLGIESGNDKTLALCRKPLSIKMLYRKAAIVKKYPELYVTANYMVGFPFENYGDMMNTYKVAEDVGFDWNNFAIYQPLPGTPFFQDMDKVEQENFDYDSVITLPFKNYAGGNKEQEARTRRIFQGQIDKQMDSTLMNQENQKYDNLDNQTYDYKGIISETALMKDLEINYIRNKNLNGKNIDRAIRDFKGVLRYIQKDHAIANYCLAKAYEYKGDTKSMAHYIKETTDILNNPLKKEWVKLFEKLVPKDELSKFGILLNKNIVRRRLQG